jgi:hypothetical protein
MDRPTTEPPALGFSRRSKPAFLLLLWLALGLGVPSLASARGGADDFIKCVQQGLVDFNADDEIKALVVQVHFEAAGVQVERRPGLIGVIISPKGPALLNRFAANLKKRFGTTVIYDEEFINVSQAGASFRPVENEIRISVDAAVRLRPTEMEGHEAIHAKHNADPTDIHSVFVDLGLGREDGYKAILSTDEVWAMGFTYRAILNAEARADSFKFRAELGNARILSAHMIGALRKHLAGLKIAKTMTQHDADRRWAFDQQQSPPGTVQGENPHPPQYEVYRQDDDGIYVGIPGSKGAAGYLLLEMKPADLARFWKLTWPERGREVHRRILAIEEEITAQIGLNLRVRDAIDPFLKDNAKLPTASATSFWRDIEAPWERAKVQMRVK